MQLLHAKGINKMCIVCVIREANGIEPINHTEESTKSFKDGLIEQKADLTLKLEIVDKLLDMFDNNEQLLEDFIKLAQRRNA